MNEHARTGICNVDNLAVATNGKRLEIYKFLHVLTALHVYDVSPSVLLGIDKVIYLSNDMKHLQYSSAHSGATAEFRCRWYILRGRIYIDDSKTLEFSSPECSLPEEEEQTPIQSHANVDLVTFDALASS